jgi:hypothetical protein
MDNQITKSQNVFSLAPQSLQEAMHYAGIIAKSGMVPKDFRNNPGNVLLAVQMGVELGLPPTQALQNISVINGKPSLWGDAVLGICKGSSLCEYVRERWDDQTKTATCIAKRRGDSEEVVRTFSFDDAKKAGLLNKQGPWSQYPERMAQMRARSFCLRDAFPDLLIGISVREEQEDIEEKDITPQKQSTVVHETRREEVLSLISDEEEAGETEQEPVAELVDDGPTEEDIFNNLLVAIRSSRTIEDLAELDETCKTLGEKAKNEIRVHYSNRLKEIKNA